MSAGPEPNGKAEQNCAGGKHGHQRAGHEMNVARQIEKNKIANIGEPADKSRQPDRCHIATPDQHGAKKRHQSDPTEVPTVLIEQGASGGGIITHQCLRIDSIRHGLYRTGRVAGDDDHTSKYMNGAPDRPEHRRYPKKTEFEWWHCIALETHHAENALSAVYRRQRVVDIVNKFHG